MSTEDERTLKPETTERAIDATSRKQVRDNLLDRLQPIADAHYSFAEEDVAEPIKQQLETFLAEVQGDTKDFSVTVRDTSDDMASAEGVTENTVYIDGEAVAVVVNENGELSVEAGAKLDAWLTERVPALAEAEAREKAEKAGAERARQETALLAAQEKATAEQAAKAARAALDASAAPKPEPMRTPAPTPASAPEKKPWWKIWG